jgi:hypothetical protein
MHLLGAFELDIRPGTARYPSRGHNRPAEGNIRSEWACVRHARARNL